ncbi:hypothetical protein ACFFNY_21890 [Paenibacillus hodogayensis]|uniref:YqzN/YkzM domain-containing protein n=1 Tax=Paenibacillus hodogayensis TaxID=279208 RepID=A0ABV5W0X5_9BACL
MAGKKDAPRQPEQESQALLPAYSREELLEHAEVLFAIKPEVLAGALYGSDQGTYTIEETERYIRQFQQRKVYL